MHKESDGESLEMEMELSVEHVLMAGHVILFV